MKKFEVIVSRRSVQTKAFTVKATNKDDAIEKAQKLAEDDNSDWEVTLRDDYDAYEVKS
jgi:hypothetical protein